MFTCTLVFHYYSEYDTLQTLYSFISNQKQLKVRFKASEVALKGCNLVRSSVWLQRSEPFEDFSVPARGSNFPNFCVNAALN